MATWKKVNEAYFGDTFNRDAMLCSADIAYDTTNDSDCAVAKGIIWNDNNSLTATATAACNNIAINQCALNSINGYDICTKDEISDKFYELQAQINDLKKKLETKKENSELRSALKTLHYKREVE